MAKVRLILVGVLALCAFGAVASASAMAGTYDIGGAAITGTHTVTSVNKGVAALLSTGLEILCESAVDTGTIEVGGKSKTEVTFTKCTVDKPANCVVEEPIITKANDILELSGSTFVDKFSPETGTTFVTLKFKAGTGCSLTTVAVKGTCTAAIDNELEAVTHTLTFETPAAPCKLEAGGLPASLDLKDEVKLSGVDAGKTFAALDV